MGGGILLYADPPYLITEATYNAGWTESDDADLMKYLDKMDAQGYKFMMSNVLQHRGRTNNHLVEWSKKYKVTQLAMDYSNCNYRAKNSNEPTVEVVITNY